MKGSSGQTTVKLAPELQPPFAHALFASWLHAAGKRQQAKVHSRGPVAGPPQWHGKKMRNYKEVRRTVGFRNFRSIPAMSEANHLLVSWPPPGASVVNRSRRRSYPQHAVGRRLTQMIEVAIDFKRVNYSLGEHRGRICTSTVV